MVFRLLPFFIFLSTKRKLNSICFRKKCKNCRSWIEGLSCSAPVSSFTQITLWGGAVGPTVLADFSAFENTRVFRPKIQNFLHNQQIICSMHSNPIPQRLRFLSLAVCCVSVWCLFVINNWLTEVVQTFSMGAQGNAPCKWWTGNAKIIQGGISWCMIKTGPNSQCVWTTGSKSVWC